MTVARASDENPTQIAAAKPSRNCIARSTGNHMLTGGMCIARARRIYGASGPITNDFRIETKKSQQV